jgi:D-serine deaminase-like pyridoxal phosphate-dependent protein
MSAAERRAALRSELGQRGSELAPVLADLPTPCLVADLAAARSNARAGAHAAGELGARLRPHAKAHKCSALLRLQVAEDNTSGITCATSAEALALAQAGFRDVLVANEVVSRRGVMHLIAAAGQLDRLAIAVDSDVGVEAAAAVAAGARRDVGVLVDLDVGSGRCGLPPASDAALAIARAVERSRDLRLDGLMGYASHANLKTEEDRRRVAAEVGAALRATSERFAEAGLPVSTVSGGSTGMWNLDQGLTELQFGSYVLMEASYALCLEDAPFVPALFCAATVVSRPTSDRAVLNAGWKSISGELGLPLTPEGLEAKAFADEHLICRIEEGADPAPGDQVLVLPAHLDPTMNLHPRVFVLDDSQIADEWPVDLRVAA